MTEAPAAAPPATAVVISLDTDDEDDVEVVSVVRGEFAPAAPVALVRPGGEDDVFEVPCGEAAGDVQVVGVLGTAPVLPHHRDQCRRHSFVGGNTDVAQERNVLACEQCFCYICDVAAARCAAWEAHCMASERVSAWRCVREKTRREGKMVRPPLPLLPPKLRAAAVPPHLREQCGVYPFISKNTDFAQQRNERMCTKCMCFVCGFEASQCSAWGSHCMAIETETAWQNLRRSARDHRQGVTVEVPSLLLPPKLLRARRARVAWQGMY